jgi:hypothetical protein
MDYNNLDHQFPLTSTKNQNLNYWTSEVSSNIKIQPMNPDDETLGDNTTTNLGTNYRNTYDSDMISDGHGKVTQLEYMNACKNRMIKKILCNNTESHITNPTMSLGDDTKTMQSKEGLGSQEGGFECQNFKKNAQGCIVPQNKMLSCESFEFMT